MAAAATLPMIIQGGMGIGVSNWRLARTVSLAGQLGVVSGTAIDSLFVRRLQDGDPGEHIRRALERFPIPAAAEAALEKFFLPDGRPEGTAYKQIPLYRQVVTKAREQITMMASFVEVHLAKEGHDGPIGINLLTKVQMPNLATLYGALLAGVDYVLMGAGIPREIPGALDRLAQHEPASLKFDVEGPRAEQPDLLTFEPARHWDADAPPPLMRPKFLPIISSSALATMLVRKSTGRVDGFVVEGPTAGGHNAPPRERGHYNDRGEPVYGERDVADLAAIAEHGLPYWVAGGAGSPDGLRQALDAGAAGIQVGTLFAYCDESGLAEEFKRPVIRAALSDEVDVVTDAEASPTGFPFKVVQLRDTASEREVYEKRERVCDLGYLRTAFRRDDGRLEYHCPAEPVRTYVAKGGAVEETAGRKCLCNALMTNIGHGQVRDGGKIEPGLLTSGDELRNLGQFLEGRESYSARDVLSYLLAGVSAAAAAV
jgi:nitronate monooxygenase